MPELPEVEIIRQSLNKKIIQKTIKKVIVRNRNLRIEVPQNVEKMRASQLRKQFLLPSQKGAQILIFSPINNCSEKPQ